MIDQILDALSLSVENPDARAAIAPLATELTQLSAEETSQLYDRLVDFSSHTDDSVWPDLLATLFNHVVQVQDGAWCGFADKRLEEIYRRCPPNHVLRNYLLAMLAKPGGEQELNQWADWICSDPPTTSLGIEFAFSPLLSERAKYSEQLLVRLINDAAGNMYVAAAVYELCNHAFRKGRVRAHPAKDRQAELRELLGVLIGKLSQFEEGNLPDGTEPAEIAATVSNAVALIIALIDTLALLGDEQAGGKLHQAMELRHRRIQVEAAAALARMNDEAGKQKLIDCAKHPIVRQRVIAYCRELGCDDEISLEYKGAIATAESHLAMWLAEPAQMGIAPTKMELVNERELYWPSYEDPVSCFLFRFEYGTDDNAFRNIGIHGPLTHAFTADLTSLSVDDQYAAFAGWQTVSEEIFLIPLERAEKLMAGETSRLKKMLDRQDFSVESIEAVSGFFGGYFLVASGVQKDSHGTLIVGEDESTFISHGNEQAPIDWRLALDIWRGRKLLSSFNPAFAT